ncbi:unnamed protein product [Auanema sp. JU1783]|nr:unnamed protein product [Auanema sp. JU1783]
MAEVTGADIIRLSDTTEQEDFNFSPRGKCHVCGGYENGRFKIPKCKSTRRAMIVQLKLPKQFEEALISRNNVQLCSLHFPKSAFMVVKGKKILYDRRKVLPYKMPKWSEMRGPSEDVLSKPGEVPDGEVDQDMFSFATNYLCVICDKRRTINELKVLPIKAKPRLDSLVQLGMPDYYFWEIMIAPNPLICYSHIPKEALPQENDVS